MASYTDNLNLLKKNPLTDGNDTFNIQTMLNENWDKIDEAIGDAAAQAQKMGLTGDLSIGASLNVLANIGNVHVWERGEAVPQEVERKIEISTTTKNIIYQDDSITVYCGTGVKLSGDSLALDGTLATTTIGAFHNGSHYDKEYFYTSKNPNIFYKFNGVSSASSNNRTYSVYEITINEKIVNIFEYDYLTSTDPNAYPKQSAEGGQDASYVLGDVVSDVVYLGFQNASVFAALEYADSVSVGDDGIVTLVNSTPINIGHGATNQADDIGNLIVGKFIAMSSNGSMTAGEPTLSVGKIVYIPDTATVSYELAEYQYTRGYFVLSKYQPVTGYPAIPANTVITYLGQLGEPGAKIEVGSYVGTGTYGADNPCSISARFPIKRLDLIGYVASGTFYQIYNAGDYESATMLDPLLRSDSFSRRNGFYIGTGSRNIDNTYGKKDSSGKTFSWYTTVSDSFQCNSSGYVYYYTAIG